MGNIIQILFFSKSKRLTIQLSSKSTSINYTKYFKMSEEPTLPRKHKIVTEVDDFGRKKFALQEDSESEDLEQTDRLIDTGRHASTLIGRQEKIGIEKYIGKLQNNKKDKKTEVFFCEVCKVGFKCDLAYITHVNSPSHNRKLGMNMKVQAASIDDVAQKLTGLKKNQFHSKKQAKMQKLLEKENNSLKKQHKYFPENEEEDEELNTRNNKKPSNTQVKKEDDQALKKEEIQQKEQKEQQQEEQQQEEEEDEMMKIMGFSSFGTKKKKY